MTDKGGTFNSEIWTSRGSGCSCAGGGVGVSGRSSPDRRDDENGRTRGGIGIGRNVLRGTCRPILRSCRRSISCIEGRIEGKNVELLELLLRS
jgi:hypothetical protein